MKNEETIVKPGWKRNAESLTMKSASALAIAFALCGCEHRPNGMSAVPDRGGHEPNICFGFGPSPRAFDVQDRGGLARSSTDPALDGAYSGLMPSPGEMWYTIKQNENLYEIARRFNIGLAWLIKRNDIQKEQDAREGRQIILPRMPIPIQ